MSRLHWALWSPLLLLAGCGPEDASGTVNAWVYRLEPITRSYTLQVATVDNLESLRAVRGRDLELRRGSELNTSLAGFQVVRGDEFTLEYTVDEDGTVRPGDLHSFYALSLYRSLDRTAALLRERGFAPAERLNVYYFPRMDNLVLGDTRATFTDNAAYASFANGFLIVPSLLLGELPMFLNEGVMAHEYGHAVIQELTFAGAGASAEADPHAMAMHEGVADLIGFVASWDPNYILPTANVDRDLAEPRDYTSADYSKLVDYTGELLDPFDPHYDGSVMARAVYELWPKLPDGTMSRDEQLRLLDTTLAALGDIRYVPLSAAAVALGADEPQAFTLATFLDKLVARLPAAERPAACAVLRQRLAPLSARLYSCEGL